MWSSCDILEVQVVCRGFRLRPPLHLTTVVPDSWHVSPGGRCMKHSWLWLPYGTLPSPTLPYPLYRPHNVPHNMQFEDSDLLGCRGQLKCDVTRAETRFRLSAKRTSPNWRGRQFSRLLAAEVCASAVVMVVMLDTPCSEVVWRVLAVFHWRTSTKVAVPKDPVSPHCYNRPQYQRTQCNPTAITGRSTKGPSLTPLL